MNEKINTIRRKCIEANPSILNLENGCLLKVAWVPDERITPELLEWGNGRDLRDEGDGTVFEDNQHGKVVEILGRDIRLADVLVAIPVKVEIDNKGRLHAVGKVFSGQTTRKIKKGTWEATRIACEWNLLKDNLNDQSPETIDFLYSLLK